ncbi:MAG: hypothetical protein WBW61_12495 [Rhodanobacteraceae bacterium]
MMEAPPSMRVLAILATTALVSNAAASISYDIAPGRPRPDAPSGTLAFYGEVPDGAGYDYVVFAAGGGVIAPLDRLFSAGTFANDDFSREYAIESASGILDTIDIATGAVTAIGSTGLVDPRTSMRWDSHSGVTFAVEPMPDCTASSLYSVDLASGAATLIAPLAGSCVKSMAIDPAGTIYLLDIATDALERYDSDSGAVDLVGPLDFDVDDTTSMDFSGASLYAVSGAGGSKGDNLYILDTTTGLSQIIGVIDVENPITAFATGVRRPDAIFADGFDAP